MFDSDPTVSCFDNIYQRKCYYQVPTEVRNMPILHFQCVDYYNTSDNGFLWWQQLQKSATFLPIRYSYRYLDLDTNDCTFAYTNFYMTYHNRQSIVRIDPSRGLLLRQTYQPNVAYICVEIADVSLDSVSGLRSAIVTFLRCLTNYGTGIQL